MVSQRPKSSVLIRARQHIEVIQLSTLFYCVAYCIMHFQYILYFLYAAVVVKVGYILTQSFISPLRSVPGPLPARFTSLWYFFKVWEGHFEDVTMALHKRYGPVVRLTPNKYSIDSVEGMSIIYNVHTKYPKSDWYDGWRHPNPKLWTIVSILLVPFRPLSVHFSERQPSC